MTAVPVSLIAAALPGARLSGRADAVVRGLCAESQAVRPGDLFACVPGHRRDGHEFAAEAVRRGATGVLCERPLTGLDERAGCVRVGSVAEALSALAPRWYNLPSLSLRLVGVTGTNGKTTLTHLVRAILEERSDRGPAPRVGVIGTIRHGVGRRSEPARNTTPPVWELQRLLRGMADQRCAAVVMEVSSHGLVEGRTLGCEFDVAVFTNLTPEHLDFHRTLEAYAAAKERLFAQLTAPGFKTGTKWAVVNADDPQAPRMAAAAAGARVLRYGLLPSAEITAADLVLTPLGTRFTLITPAGRTRVRLALPGVYNVSNALAAAGAALALGATLTAVRRGLERVACVPGRMERVDGGQPFAVLVDYAHTPDALQKALENVRQFTRGRVLVVFGCGGDRDPTKRAPMGELAARLADAVVLTSDNPRGEDPERILDQVEEGCRRAGGVCQREPDRARALRRALAQARSGDTVLIAGKGHETYQLLGGKRLPFSDPKVAARELRKLGYGKAAKRRGRK